MDGNVNITIKKLLTIRQKHLKYFITHNLKIRDCVKIIWVKPYTAHVVNDALCAELTYDIETMFWIGDDSVTTVKNIRTERLKNMQTALMQLHNDMELYKYNSQKFKANIDKFREVQGNFAKHSSQICAQ